MKKILMLAVATAALSTASFAATMTVSCGQVQYDKNQVLSSATPSATISCPSFAVAVAPATVGALPGQVVFNSVSLLYLLDNSTVIGNTYNATLAFTSGIGNVSYTASQAGYSYGDPGSGANISTGPTPFSNVTSGGFSVTTNTPVVNSGNLPGSSYSFAVTYDYSVVPSGVPEPSTVALIGAGLVGLASVARRRRS